MPKVFFSVLGFISSISLLWLITIAFITKEKNYEDWILLAITYVKLYMFNVVVSQTSIILAAVYLWWLSTQRLKATVKLEEDQKRDTVIETVNATEIETPTPIGDSVEICDTESEDGDADADPMNASCDSVDSWDAPMSDMVKAMLNADVKRRNLRDSVLSSLIDPNQNDRTTLKNELLGQGYDSD